MAVQCVLRLLIPMRCIHVSRRSLVSRFCVVVFVSRLFDVQLCTLRTAVCVLVVR